MEFLLQKLLDFGVEIHHTNYELNSTHDCQASINIFQVRIKLHWCEKVGTLNELQKTEVTTINSFYVNISRQKYARF